MQHVSVPVHREEHFTVPVYSQQQQQFVQQQPTVVQATAPAFTGSTQFVGAPATQYINAPTQVIGGAPATQVISVTRQQMFQPTIATFSGAPATQMISGGRVLSVTRQQQFLPTSQQFMQSGPMVVFCPII